MKKCSKCKKEKPLEEFFKVSRVFKNPSVNIDRRNTVCKKCTSKRIAINRKNNPEKYAEMGRIWTKNNPERRKEIRCRWQNSPKGYYQALKKRGVENVKISKVDFIEWYLKQEKKCFYCKLPEELIEKFVGNKMSKSRRLSIDRINPKGVYEIDNIVLACGICNMVKSDIFTKEEMLEVGKIINIKWNKLYV